VPTCDVARREPVPRFAGVLGADAREPGVTATRWPRSRAPGVSQDDAYRSQVPADACGEVPHSPSVREAPPTPCGRLWTGLEDAWGRWGCRSYRCGRRGALKGAECPRLLPRVGCGSAASSGRSRHGCGRTRLSPGLAQRAATQGTAPRRARRRPHPGVGGALLNQGFLYGTAPVQPAAILRLTASRETASDRHRLTAATERPAGPLRAESPAPRARWSISSRDADAGAAAYLGLQSGHLPVQFE
jgi:hypothetical protein